MNGSGLGRSGAQNEYFGNKALIKNEQIRARTARSPIRVSSPETPKTTSENKETRASSPWVLGWNYMRLDGFVC